MKTAGSLLVLLLAAGPAKAQDGPSFDCRQAGTATEQAICVSPGLARLERSLVASYESLADRIGRRQARALADEQLALRQACRGESACIEDRLIATTRLFDAEVTEPPQVADAIAIAPPVMPDPPVPSLEALAEAPPRPTDLAVVVRPEERPARGPLSGVEGEETVAAWPLEAEALEGFPMVVRADDLVVEATADLETALAGEEVLAISAATSSSEAGLGTEPSPVLQEGPVLLEGPVSAFAEAFAALPSYRRANLQGRLVEAGYGDFVASGAWNAGTAAALAAVLRDAATSGRDFDPSTPAGAAALLDFVDSDGFKRNFLGEKVSFEPQW